MATISNFNLLTGSLLLQLGRRGNSSVSQSIHPDSPKNPTSVQNPDGPFSPVDQFDQTAISDEARRLHSDSTAVSSKAEPTFQGYGAIEPKEADSHRAIEEDSKSKQKVNQIDGNQKDGTTGRGEIQTNSDDVTPSPENEKSGDRGNGSFKEMKPDSEKTLGKEESASQNGEEPSDDEAKQIKELKERDSEVRAHESAHAAVAGRLANGGPSYDYERGPDGRQYAVGGHVNISFGGGNSPEEKRADALQAERAALAPAEPSGQDRKVAMKAHQAAVDAEQEMNAEESDAKSGHSEFGNAAIGEIDYDQKPAIKTNAVQPDDQSKIAPSFDEAGKGYVQGIGSGSIEIPEAEEAKSSSGIMTALSPSNDNEDEDDFDTASTKKNENSERQISYVSNQYEKLERSSSRGVYFDSFA